MLPVSEFGLIEITRQRSRGNLEKLLTRSCPDCNGSGRVKTDLTVALDLRRSLQRHLPLYAAGETIRVRVTPSLARLIAEEEPDFFGDMEAESGLRIELLEDPTLPPAVFEVLPR